MEKDEKLNGREAATLASLIIKENEGLWWKEAQERSNAPEELSELIF